MSKGTQYLYEDIRGCIREGLSAKETADLCGCNINTVYKWSKDIREGRHRADKNEVDKVIELHNNKVSMNDISKETGIEFKRVRYIIGYYGKKGNKMVKKPVHNRIKKEDILIESIAEEGIIVEKNNIQLPEVNPVGNNIFSNFTACFDGRNARYTVRFNKKVRIVINNVDFEIPISQLKDMSVEFAEIAKRFDCFA